MRRPEFKEKWISRQVIEQFNIPLKKKGRDQLLVQTPKSSAKVGVIMPQPQCQMWCEFCVTDDHLQRMTESQAQKLIHKMAEQGFTSLIIGGGEPLLWPHDVLKLADYAKKFEFFVQIGTNGIRLPNGFETLPQVVS